MDREKAVAFVEGYGRTWQAWDFEGFADLFTDDVVYVEHPTDETVAGREQMLDYIRREQTCCGRRWRSDGLAGRRGRLRSRGVLDDDEQTR